MPAQNGLIDESMSMEMPTTKVSEDELIIEKSMANFATTSEYKRLKEHLESRVAFYQSFLPDGRDLRGIDDASILGVNWKVANAIIGEFNAVLAAYENAKEAVKNVNR